MLLSNGITTLHFEVYAHQSTATDPTTGICNTLLAHSCQKLSALYGFNLMLLTPFTVNGSCIINLHSVFIQVYACWILSLCLFIYIMNS